MNRVLKGMSKDAFLVSCEITFTYLPTYTATRSHTPGNVTRIYCHETPIYQKVLFVIIVLSTSVQLQIYAVGKADL